MIITDILINDAEVQLLEHSGWSLQYRFTINNNDEETQIAGTYNQIWKAYHRYSGRIVAFSFPTFASDDPDTEAAAQELVDLVGEWLKPIEEDAK